jgi:nucleotide-binding universal stress UspA family protein
MVGNEGGGLIRGRNLLLATDGKPHSMKAAQYAIELAGLASSRLYMIYVVSGNDEGDKKRLDELKSLAAESGVEAITLLEGGNVYESVLSAAERIRAGAIIVGTSGKSTLDRVLMGSVSEHVVRNSRCSVIVIR